LTPASAAISASRAGGAAADEHRVGGVQNPLLVSPSRRRQPALFS
jgi:hypothetical protein